MRKLLLSMAVAFFGLCANAQVAVEEPEFSDETLMLVSDTEGVKLKRESATIKTKAGASLIITGIGKIRSKLTIKGEASASTVKGSSTTRLIVRADDNKTDPTSFINIFKFEIKKGDRTFLLSQLGTFTGAEECNTSGVEFKAKKYGESSYYIVMEDLEPGEYGILIGDPDNVNEKNAKKVTTFSVE